MHSRQPNPARETRCQRIDDHVCDHRCTSRMDCSAVQPARDPLAALEAARRIAFEEEMAERWDGMA